MHAAARAEPPRGALALLAAGLVLAVIASALPMTGTSTSPMSYASDAPTATPLEAGAGGVGGAGGSP